MMYTSPSLSQKKLQEARLNLYKSNRNPYLGVMADNCRLSKKLRKRLSGQGRQRHKPCAQQRELLINPSAENTSKQATLWPMMFRQFVTETLITNSRRCRSDAMRLIGRCMPCLLPCSGRLKWYHPCLLQVYADTPAQLLGPVAIVRHDIEYGSQLDL